MDHEIALQPVDGNQPFRQGDILCRISQQEQKEWGVIITADCDIANDKAGSYFTFLTIVTSDSYLKDSWAPEALRKVGQKTALKASELLSRAARKCDPGLADLSPEDVVEWLMDRSAAEVAAKVNDTSGAMLNLLEAVRLSHGIGCSNDPAFARLRAVWKLQGVSARGEHERFEAALDYNKNPEYVFLPFLPQEHFLGYVVLLRSFQSVWESEVYKSLLSARIADRPNAWHRIGRLADYVRYSITQRMAFLFSRIGMRSVFETYCDSAVSQTLARLTGEQEPEV